MLNERFDAVLTFVAFALAFLFRAVFVWFERLFIYYSLLQAHYLGVRCAYFNTFHAPNDKIKQVSNFPFSVWS